MQHFISKAQDRTTTDHFFRVWYILGQLCLRKRSKRGSVFVKWKHQLGCFRGFQAHYVVLLGRYLLNKNRFSRDFPNQISWEENVGHRRCSFEPPLASSICPGSPGLLTWIVRHNVGWGAISGALPRFCWRHFLQLLGCCIGTLVSHHLYLRCHLHCRWSLAHPVMFWSQFNRNFPFRKEGQNPQIPWKRSDCVSSF